MAKNTKTPDSQQDTPQAAKSITAQPGQSSNNTASSTSTEIRAEKKERKPSISNLTWNIEGEERNKQQVKEWLIETIEHNSYSLRKALQVFQGTPQLGVIYEWLKKDQVFNENYRASRVSMADFLSEEILEIADDSRNDYMQSLDNNGESTGGWKFNGDNVQRAKLMIWSRMWLMAKRQPTVYGDKVTVEHKEAPLSEKSMNELEDMARTLLNQRVVSEQ